MMALNHHLIGRRIKETRMASRLSQAQLAERVGLSSVFISNIETGAKKPSVESLLRIANALGVTVNHFVHDGQPHDSTECISELVQLMADCNTYAQRVICETAFALKKSLGSWRGHS